MKKKLIIIVALVVVLGVSAYFLLFRKKKTSSSVAGTSLEGSDASSGVGVASDTLTSIEKLTWDADSVARDIVYIDDTWVTPFGTNTAYKTAFNNLITNYPALGDIYKLYVMDACEGASGKVPNTKGWSDFLFFAQDMHAGKTCYTAPAGISAYKSKENWGRDEIVKL